MATFSDLSPENVYSESYNGQAVQAEIDVSGNGVTAFVNVANSQTGNLEDRQKVRLLNVGQKIRWRIFGQLTGSAGEDIGKNEAVEFPFGENIIIEVVERNSNNEIKIIVTEYN